MRSVRSSAQTRFVVLPPASVDVPDVFRNVQADHKRYDDLLAAMQRFRGKIYKSDGAIGDCELTNDGRHKVAIDEESWHVLGLDSAGAVVSCLRYLDESHAKGFQQLWVKHAAISRCPQNGTRFRGAVEDCMRQAVRRGLNFGEVGGWAVAEEHRNTLEPLRIILATYGLLELLGGCTGLATATMRHSSAPILRRIGLTSIHAWGEEVPPYYDAAYGCDMQVLRFDSGHPAERYRSWVEELAATLMTSPVVCRHEYTYSFKGVLRNFEIPAKPVLVPAAV